MEAAAGNGAREAAGASATLATTCEACSVEDLRISCLRLPVAKEGLFRKGDAAAIAARPLAAANGHNY